MKKAKSPSAGASELRRRAEERLRKKGPEDQHPPTEAESQRLIHELQVHQVELELQNEELRLAREELENALERYTDLYDFAPVGYLTLDYDGFIRAANLTGASLLGVARSRLIGRPFGHFFTDENRPLFAGFLGKVFDSEAGETCDSALMKEGDHQIYIQIKAQACAGGRECRIALVDITPRKHMEDELHRLNEELETRIRERTAELEAKNAELQRTIRLFVNRELRMVELKEKLAQLEKNADEETLMT